MAKDTQKTIEGTIGAFKQLKQEVAQLKDELSSLTKEGKTGTAEWTKKAKELADAQKKVDAVTKAAKGNFAAYNAEQVKSINDLKERIKLLNQERNAMDMNSKEYAEATKELKVLNDQLREAGTSAGDWKANVGNYAGSLKDALGELGTAAGSLTGSIGGLNAGMLKLATNPVGATVLALVSAIKFLADGIKSSEENTKRWNEVLVPVKTVLVMIQQAAQDAASKFLDFAEGLGKSEKVGKTIQTVLQVIVTLFEQTKNRINGLIEGITNIFNKVKGYVDKFKEWAEGLKNTFQPVIDFVDNISDKIKEKLSPIVDWIISKYNALAKTDLGKIFGLQTIEQVKESWDKAGKVVDDTTDKFKKVEDQVRKTTKAENELGATLDGLMKRQAQLEGEVADANRKYQEALENGDLVAAQEALNKKKEKEIELAKVAVGVASANANVLREQAKLTGNSTEANRALAQAEAEVIRAQNGVTDAVAKTSQEQRKLNKLVEQAAKEKSMAEYKAHLEELNTELNKLTENYKAAVASLETPLKPEGGEVDTSSLDAYYDQINENAKAEYDAYVALQQAKMEELQKFIDAELAAGRDASKEKVELAKLREEETLGYAAQYKKMNDTITKSNKERAKMQLALQRSELKGYADLMDSVSGLFEQNTVAYKATATAKALINTYLAATSALAETPGGAIAKGIAMAATLAAGLAQVISIWKVNPSGENSVPSANASTPTVAEPVMEETQPFTYTRQAQTFEEEDQLNQPVWVSVQEIDRVQNRVRVTENESSF